MGEEQVRISNVDYSGLDYVYMRGRTGEGRQGERGWEKGEKGWEKGEKGWEKGEKGDQRRK